VQGAGVFDFNLLFVRRFAARHEAEIHLARIEYDVRPAVEAEAQVGRGYELRADGHGDRNLLQPGKTLGIQRHFYVSRFARLKGRLGRLGGAAAARWLEIGDLHWYGVNVCDLEAVEELRAARNATEVMHERIVLGVLVPEHLFRPSLSAGGRGR